MTSKITRVVAFALVAAMLLSSGLITQTAQAYSGTAVGHSYYYAGREMLPDMGQGSLYYAQGMYWYFYPGTGDVDLQYRTSADGSTWSAVKDTGVDMGISHMGKINCYSCLIDADTFYLASLASDRRTVMYGTATVHSDGTIGTVQQRSVVVSGEDDNLLIHGVWADSNGIPYIAYDPSAGIGSYIIRATDATGSSWGTPFNTNDDGWSAITMAKLTSGHMLAYNAGKFYLWNGVSWGQVGDTGWGQTGQRAQLVSDGDGVAHLVLGMQYSIYYITYSEATGLSDPLAIATGLPVANVSPVVAVKGENLAVFCRNSNIIYSMTRTGNEWSALSTFVTEGGIRVMEYTLWPTPIMGQIGGTLMAGVQYHVYNGAGAGDAMFAQFTMDVSGPAAPWAPTFTSTPIGEWTAGAFYSYSPSCNETVTFTVESKPSWLTWVAGTATFSGTPAAAGSYDVKLRADGPGGLPSYQNWTITVEPGPAAPWAPSFTSSPPLTGQAYTTYTYAVSCNETVTYLVHTKPSWASWNGGTLSGTPTLSGNYDVKIRATGAGGLSAWQNWTISVGNPPPTWAPTWTSTPGTSAAVGQQYSYAPSCNETVTFTVGSKPDWLTWSGNTFSGVPTAAGSYHVSISAMGAGGITVYQSWTIVVSSTPAVTITTEPTTRANVNGTYSYTPSSAGTITVESKPSWLTWDAANGTLTGTPTEKGNYSVSIMASAYGLTTWQNWTIMVSPEISDYEWLFGILLIVTAITLVVSMVAGFSRKR